MTHEKSELEQNMLAKGYVSVGMLAAKLLIHASSAHRLLDTHGIPYIRVHRTKFVLRDALRRGLAKTDLPKAFDLETW